MPATVSWKPGATHPALLTCIDASGFNHGVPASIRIPCAHCCAVHPFHWLVPLLSHVRGARLHICFVLRSASCKFLDSSSYREPVRPTTVLRSPVGETCGKLVEEIGVCVDITRLLSYCSNIFRAAQSVLRLGHSCTRGHSLAWVEPRGYTSLFNVARVSRVMTGRFGIRRWSRKRLSHSTSRFLDCYPRNLCTT